MRFALLALVALEFLIVAGLVAYYFRSLTQKLLKWGRLFAASGSVLLFFILVADITKSPGSLEVIGSVSTLLFSLLGALFLLRLLWKRKLLHAVSIGYLSLAIIVLFSPLLQGYQETLKIPSIWIWAHVSTLVLGEVLFFLAAALGASYLVLNRQLKSKIQTPLVLGSTPLPKIDELMGMALFWGWSLLTTGLVLGSFFAREFWAGPWWFDAKVVFALFTWFIYAGLLLGRMLSPSIFLGRRSALVSVIGFCVVLLLSVGMDYFFDTKHREMKTAVEHAL